MSSPIKFKQIIILTSFFFLREKTLLELFINELLNQSKQTYQYPVEHTPSRLTKEKKVLFFGLKYVQPHFLAEERERKRNS